MKIAIRYLSLSEKQNGVKLAKAISEVAGVEALPIDKPLEEEVDVLFLVNAMYGFMIDSKVGEFIGKNAQNIKLLVNVSSSCSGLSTFKRVKKESIQYGVQVSDKEFHTKGSFKCFNKTRPNEDDLNKLKEFVKGVISE
jgi:hypothetical protein